MPLFSLIVTRARHHSPKTADGPHPEVGAAHLWLYAASPRPTVVPHEYLLNEGREKSKEIKYFGASQYWHWHPGLSSGPEPRVLWGRMVRVSLVALSGRRVALHWVPNAGFHRAQKEVGEAA